MIIIGILLSTAHSRTTRHCRCPFPARRRRRPSSPPPLPPPPTPLHPQRAKEAAAARRKEATRRRPATTPIVPVRPCSSRMRSRRWVLMKTPVRWSSSGGRLPTSQSPLKVSSERRVAQLVVVVVVPAASSPLAPSSTSVGTCPSSRLPPPLAVSPSPSRTPPSPPRLPPCRPSSATITTTTTPIITITLNQFCLRQPFRRRPTLRPPSR